MKQRKSLFQLFTLLLCTIGVFLGGCASTSIPLAQNPPLYAQEKIQAVDHWDNIANTVAMRIQKSLEDRPDLVNLPLYVVQPNARPFSEAFRSLLVTRLVSKGMQVLERPEPNALQIEYDVQMILYNSTRQDWLPTLASMGVGVVNMVTGTYGSASQHEIIVNSRMAVRNRYVMHLSSVHYINDADVGLYVDPQVSDPKSSTIRRVPFNSQ